MAAEARATVARTWTGAVRTVDVDAYVGYVRQTGIEQYLATDGNRGAWTLTRDRGDGLSEIITVSHWTSVDVIRGFAGDDIEQAVFYPEDDRFLVERDLTVKHYRLDGC